MDNAAEDCGMAVGSHDTFINTSMRETNRTTCALSCLGNVIVGNVIGVASWLLAVACRFLVMPMTDSLIWMFVWGQYLDVYAHPTPFPHSCLSSLDCYAQSPPPFPIVVFQT